MAKFSLGDTVKHIMYHSYGTGEIIGIHEINRMYEPKHRVIYEIRWNWRFRNEVPEHRLINDSYQNDFKEKIKDRLNG